MTAPRGFMALVSVASVSIALLLLAVGVTSDVFSLRRMVLQYEYQSVATLAAEACAESVVLRILHEDTAAFIPTSVTLLGDQSCHIDHIEREGSIYTIRTSARVGSAEIRYLTQVQVSETDVEYLISRKI